MTEVKFTYEGSNTSVQCELNDKIKDIIKKFLVKINKDKNSNLYYLYNGGKINEEITFYEQANHLDKNRKKMNVLVYNNLEEYKKNNEITSRDIICLDCKENCLIDIKDFKINFHGCKNNHAYNNILINYFEFTQKINLNEIICDICKKQNKGDAHNNEFYICNNCNKNICPLCKSNHDKNHIIINYDDKNYLCKKHNDVFNKYCKTCNENICIVCENDHDNHDILDLSKILIKKNDFNKIMEELRQSIDKYKSKIKIIKETFDKMINILDMYYKINNDIFNHYSINKRNYYNLLNVYNLKNNNEILIKDINNIKNGLKEGKAILYYNKNDEFNRKKYEGDFKNDKREGKGILYWNNNDRYEGDFKNDKIEGKGKYYWNNGDRYDGDWKNGKREGKGKYYWNNDDRYEGDYKNDRREGKGIMYYNNGKIENGDWENDEFQKNGFFNFW